jgi:hypothetical protein
MTTLPSPNTSCSAAVSNVVRLLLRSAEYVSGRVPPGGSALNIASRSSFGTSHCACANVLASAVWSQW